MGLLQDWFGPPKEIDPNKIQGMMKSEYTDQLDDRANQMMDPNSPLMKGYYNSLGQQNEDNMYTRSRIGRQNMASLGMGGQSGIMSAREDAANVDLSGNMMKQFKDMMAGNLDKSNQITSNNQQIDTQNRQMGAEAYGQNVTNKNNYNSAMGGMVLQGAGALMMCDGRMKKEVKRLGSIKTKGGKAGLYSFKYKGRDKLNHGVIAQEVQKLVPEAVHKGKNGLLYVNYSKLL
tara:strand:- start:139 stop:834 length:696 start_codon:yes stop_codon:yes gene_type:complete